MLADLAHENAMITSLTIILLSADDLGVDLFVDAAEFPFESFDIFLVLHKITVCYSSKRPMYLVYVNARSHARKTVDNYPASMYNKSMKKHINADVIIRIFLAFVLFWFGINEVMNPGMWVGFVPKFLGSGSTATTLVTIHAIVLILAGLALLAKFYIKYTAIIVALMLIEIILDLISHGGLSGIAVRDIGLLALPLALAVEAHRTSKS